MTNFLHSSYSALNNLISIEADNITSSIIIFENTLNDITPTVLSYLKNVSSDIQAQINTINQTNTDANAFLQSQITSNDDDIHTLNVEVLYNTGNIVLNAQNIQTNTNDIANLKILTNTNKNDITAINQTLLLKADKLNPSFTGTLTNQILMNENYATFKNYANFQSVSAGFFIDWNYINSRIDYDVRLMIMNTTGVSGKGILRCYGNFDITENLTGPTITNINTSINTKANINNANFTGTTTINDLITTNNIYLSAGLQSLYFSNNNSAPLSASIYSRFQLYTNNIFYWDLSGELRIRNKARTNNNLILDQSGNLTILGNIYSPTINNINSSISTLQTQVNTLINTPNVESITIGTITSINWNAQPTVINVGTATNLILNFQIPRGKNGDKGDKGDQGDRGSAGSDGKDGKDGSNGSNGADGDSSAATASAALSSISAASSAAASTASSAAASASSGYAAAAAASAADANANVAALSVRVGVLETELTTLNTIVDNLTLELTTTNNTIIELQTEVDSILLKNQAQDADILGLQSQINVHTLEIQQLQAQVNTFGFSSRSNNNYVSQF